MGIFASKTCCAGGSLEKVMTQLMKQQFFIKFISKDMSKVLSPEANKFLIELQLSINSRDTHLQSNTIIDYQPKKV
jgi:hypothetical protein